MTNMDVLIGKKVTGLFVNDGESSMKFESDDDDVFFDVDGDCCSESWFAEVINGDALIGHTVAKVEELELPTVEDGNTRQEYDSFYGYKLTTESGDATIVFRNSSNGYYGGTICVSNGLGKTGWRAISGDWTAYEKEG